jgi:hypothetical protein
MAPGARTDLPFAGEYRPVGPELDYGVKAQIFRRLATSELGEPALSDPLDPLRLGLEHPFDPLQIAFSRDSPVAELTRSLDLPEGFRLVLKGFKTPTVLASLRQPWLDQSERMAVWLRRSPHGFTFDSRRKGGCLASRFIEQMGWTPFVLPVTVRMGRLMSLPAAIALSWSTHAGGANGEPGGDHAADFLKAFGRAAFWQVVSLVPVWIVAARRAMRPEY